MRQLFFIGFMGTGKSTVAKRLGERLNRPVVELDQLIEEAGGMTISQMFETHGEEFFRREETRLLKETARGEAQIISCGGGAVLKAENVAWMKAQGDVILLNATPETIYQRIHMRGTRPLLQGNMSVEYLAEMKAKREEIYKKAATLVIDTDGKTVEEITEEILRHLTKNG